MYNSHMIWYDGGRKLSSFQSYSAITSILKVQSQTVRLFTASGIYL
jgi:hypothetical protein